MEGSAYRDNLGAVRQHLADERARLVAKAGRINHLRDSLPVGLQRKLKRLERKLEQPVNSSRAARTMEAALRRYEEAVELATKGAVEHVVWRTRVHVWVERHGGIVVLFVVLFILFPLMLLLLGATSPPVGVQNLVWVLFIANSARSAALATQSSLTARVPHLVKTWLVPGYFLVPTKSVGLRYWVVVAVGVPLVLVWAWRARPFTATDARPPPDNLRHKWPAEYVP